MTQHFKALAFDKELPPLNSTLHFDPVTSLDDVQRLRQATKSYLDSLLEQRQVQHQPCTIPGPGGDLQMSIFRPLIARSSSWKETPCIINVHPGGMVAGDRYTGIELILELVEQERVGIEWTSDNAINLGISSDRIILVGMSGGGGIAAGVALLARDRGGPSIQARMLIDDGNATISSSQLRKDVPWTHDSNEFAWNCVLDGAQGAPTVPIYAAPARASDLSGLPVTYIECGSTDVFRDENVAYASRLWECGVQSELHIWSGGWHAFQLYCPESRVAKISAETRSSWLRRQLSYMEQGN